MHVLLLRPVPANDRFGLGPFFRIEPLGLEYVAAALEARGHRATVVDLRYSRPLQHYLRRTRPALVGIACIHTLEADEVLALAAEVRSACPETFVVVGGHSAAAYPPPFFSSSVDAVCVDDGEMVVPALADALERGAVLGKFRGCSCDLGRDHSNRHARPIAPSRSTRCRCPFVATSTHGGANTPVSCFDRCG